MNTPCADTSIQHESPDSVRLRIIPPDSSLFSEAEKQAPLRFNALRAVGFSAALPGAGQAYTRHWVKGGLFLGAEAIMSTVLLSDRLPQLRDRTAQSAAQLTTLDSMQQALGGTGAAGQDASLQGAWNKARLDYRVDRYDRRATLYSVYQTIGWMSGLYAWNIMDALESSRRFADDGPRNPALAGLLSAIPGLGLGQIYNNSYSKAGLIWMTQTMLLDMAFNYNRLMQRCVDEQKPLRDPGMWQHAYKDQYDPLWTEQYNEAFRRRNMYLWYGVFFYLYGIFDAVVDAHLHDYARQIRITPHVDAHSESIGLTWAWSIPDRGNSQQRISICR